MNNNNLFHVYSQKEYDELSSKKDSKNGTFVINSDEIIKVKNASCIVTGNTRLVAEGNSFIKAHNNAYIVIKDNSTAEVYDNVRVDAVDNSNVTGNKNSKIKASGNSNITANNKTFVDASDNASVTANHYSTIIAHDNSTVRAFGFSNITADGSAKITAHDKVTITAKGRAQIDAHENTIVNLYENSFANISGNAALFISGHSPKANITGQNLVFTNNNTGYLLYKNNKALQISQAENTALNFTKNLSKIALLPGFSKTPQRAAAMLINNMHQNEKTALASLFAKSGAKNNIEIQQKIKETALNTFRKIYPEKQKHITHNHSTQR